MEEGEVETAAQVEIHLPNSMLEVRVETVVTEARSEGVAVPVGTAQSTVVEVGVVTVASLVVTVGTEAVESMLVWAVLLDMAGTEAVEDVAEQVTPVPSKAAPAHPVARAA